MGPRASQDMIAILHACDDHLPPVCVAGGQPRLGRWRQQGAPEQLCTLASLRRGLGPHLVVGFLQLQGATQDGVISDSLLAGMLGTDR
eukprot:2480795-Pyramimonas_sp.AAC.1